MGYDSKVQFTDTRAVLISEQIEEEVFSPTFILPSKERLARHPTSLGEILGETHSGKTTTLSTLGDLNIEVVSEFTFSDKELRRQLTESNFNALIYHFLLMKYYNHIHALSLRDKEESELVLCERGILDAWAVDSACELILGDDILEHKGGVNFVKDREILRMDCLSMLRDLDFVVITDTPYSFARRLREIEGAPLPGKDYMFVNPDTFGSIKLTYSILLDLIEVELNHGIGVLVVDGRDATERTKTIRKYLLEVIKLKNTF